ncbi:hypothetical protein H9650_09380 [Psychrobacillus sp. Sa2BUA9]|uniref:Lipoprotein n=1 Tax=Psychrobacillus faecigallinarum TaxID=2762235 RepID=A0ABR8R9D1_9BACI|nr:lipoprotein [Psychrobacillus faecigallinarum]MBD7944324.1 hypothetical protein [Psychrobacillus faecigallinarum]
MQKIFVPLFLIIVLAGCSNEIEIKEKPKEIVLVEEKIQLPSFDSIEKPILSLNNQIGFDSIYEEICWLDCSAEDRLNHQFNNQGQAQIGDVIRVKWDNMNPAPNKVEIKEYTNEFHQIGDTQIIADEQNGFYIEVTDTSYNKIYELIFIWEENEKSVGKSRLAFPLTN